MNNFFYSFSTASICALTFLIISCNSKQERADAETPDKPEKQVQSIPDFDIHFPNTDYKVEKTESYSEALGNVLVTNWILQGKDENGPFMYFIAHNKFPETMERQFNEPTARNIAFKGMLTGSASKLGGTDFTFNEIKYDSNEGMESTCKVFEGDGIIKSRVFKINDDLFMISAGGKKINTDSVDNFLNSFKLKI